MLEVSWTKFAESGSTLICSYLPRRFHRGIMICNVLIFHETPTICCFLCNPSMHTSKRADYVCLRRKRKIGNLPRRIVPSSPSPFLPTVTSILPWWICANSSPAKTGMKSHQTGGVSTAKWIFHISSTSQHGDLRRSEHQTHGFDESDSPSSDRHPLPGRRSVETRGRVRLAGCNFSWKPLISIYI